MKGSCGPGWETGTGRLILKPKPGLGIAGPAGGGGLFSPGSGWGKEEGTPFPSDKERSPWVS